MLKLLDANAFCEVLEEVDTSRYFDKQKFHSRGLFSEQIFGPVKSYTCQCGTYYSSIREGGTCQICGVDIVSSDERRKRFAKIVLPFPVINPIYYELLKSLVGSSLMKSVDLLIQNENSILYKIPKTDEYAVVEKEEYLPEGVKTWVNIEAIRELIRATFEVSANSSSIAKLLISNLDKLTISQVIVLPPDLRPIGSKPNVKGSQFVDEINRFYISILTKKEAMRETFFDIKREKSLFYQYFTQIQQDVSRLYKYILVKLSKKKGIIRNNILGKRIDFSGRAVIVPDPTLSFGECSLPYIMFLELYKLKLSKKLLDDLKFSTLNLALDYIDECIETSNPSLLLDCQKIAEGEYVLLNRQPTLWRLGVLGCKVKVHYGDAIKVHPLVCVPFNADFDGDQMAVYAPITKETREEVIEKFFLSKNLRNPADDNLTFIPNQDIVLGIYLVTKDDQEKIDYKGGKLSKNRLLFNECLPKNYPIVDYPVDRDKLFIILDNIKDTYEPDVCCAVLDNIKTLGFKWSTYFGITMSLDKFLITDRDNARSKIYTTEKEGIEGTREQIDSLTNKETIQFLRKNFAYSYLIDSKSRGDWDQARQIILSRGFVSNFHGEIVEKPIIHSLVEGLTPEEFFLSTYGVRKGLLDVALNTAKSGYLSRKLDFSCINLELGDNEDCSTDDYLELYIDTLDRAEMLKFRYFIEDGKLKVINEDNYKNLVGKVIKLRSPIYCQDYKICHTCYGLLAKKLNSKFIGAIASQSLGECNTQLILRTFHTSGVAIIRGEDKLCEKNTKQYDVASELPTISTLLHRTGSLTIEELIRDLFNLYISRKKLLHVHFECIVSQMLWYNGKKWRLLLNRKEVTPEIESIQRVPSNESYLVGLAFSRPKNHIVQGLLKEEKYKGVIDHLLLGGDIK